MADAKKVYHVSKRAEDGKWVIKFAGGEKVIKTFSTKDEALAYADQLAENQGGTVLFHASKGAKAGKIQKR
ncbi:MAG: DUF2188 domain-containing protein [Erysipelotrichaceae bacterium]|nr:DUF2188 domain-containing protein [Erysipelotrichaceae bacterium]